MSYSQNYSHLAGGRSAGLAHSSVALEDVWAAHHNQAALAYLTNTSLGISYENRYFLNDLSVLNVALVHPTKVANIGFSASYFGFDLYHQSKFGLNLSRGFGKSFSAGFQANYESYYVEEGGNEGNVTFELGILAKASKKLNIGFAVYNPSGNYKNKDNDERLPVIGRLGFAYEVDEKATITGEVKKQENFSEHYAVGVEYALIKQLFLRVGMGINPWTSSFGLGLDFDHWQFNVSYEYAQTLGNNANLGFQYHL